MYLDSNFRNAIHTADNTDPVKNAKNKQDNTEIVIQKETTINIKEEIRLSGTQKEPLPFSGVFNQRAAKRSFPPSETLKLVGNILELRKNDRSALADKVNTFSNQIEKMNQTQLLFLARTLGEMLKNTDGDDDILATLQDIALAELENRPDETENYLPGYMPAMPVPAEPPLELKGDFPPLPLPVIDLNSHEITRDALAWAVQIQERVPKGYILSPNEEKVYEHIQKNYKA